MRRILLLRTMFVSLSEAITKAVTKTITKAITKAMTKTMPKIRLLIVMLVVGSILTSCESFTKDNQKKKTKDGEPVQNLRKIVSGTAKGLSKGLDAIGRISDHGSLSEQEKNNGYSNYNGNNINNAPYDDKGRRDPFVDASLRHLNSKSTNEKDKTGTNGEKIDLDTLSRLYLIEEYRLAALLNTKRKKVAIFDAPQGESIIIKEGEQLGKEGYTVEKIYSNYLILIKERPSENKLNDALIKNSIEVALGTFPLQE